jgi:hypothetical protein
LTAFEVFGDVVLVVMVVVIGTKQRDLMTMALCVVVHAYGSE